MNAKAFRSHRELRIMFAAWKICLTSLDSIILPLMFFYPQMLDRCYTDGIICLRSVLYVSGHFRPVSKEFDDFLIKESGM